MKSLVRWGATLGLVGSTLLGSFFTANIQALALPEEEITKRLQPIPVFTVTDAQGAPLVQSVTVPNNNQTAEQESKTVDVARVFLSRQDANTFLANLKSKDPDLGNSVQVVPVSLAEVYELEKNSRNQTENLDFALIPKQEQVQLAQPLWQAQIEAWERQNPNQGQRSKEFQGVPLFAAKAGPDQGYLTIQLENGEQSIPFFFEKSLLQEMVDRYKQQQPSQANNVVIEVIPLAGLITALQREDNPDLNKITLMPSRESLEFLRSLRSKSNSSESK
ncbi:MAG: hypothetical protein F6J86_13285 [Symploca sp. SIO1B1]|nr:hypothetical protein [Symploca sp. SIO2D2]NER19369.1 hypothetical protein [Symploca sp. SIO1C2]NER47650.1 hypothetical protein [Symploca sp. SIO1A3]NER94791.1 hypothetical protein [Symploca sp. SIO1B1]